MLDFKSFTENLGTTLNALTPRITAPFAVTGWILLYVHARGWFVLSPSVVVVALIVGVLCTCLVLTSLAASLWAATRSLRDDCSRMVFRYRDKKRIEAELEYVIPNERGILGYLLAKNQKMFEVLPDGEEAATLIAKGFVVYPERQPPAVHRLSKRSEMDRRAPPKKRVALASVSRTPQARSQYRRNPQTPSRLAPPPRPKINLRAVTARVTDDPPEMSTW